MTSFAAQSAELNGLTGMGSLVIRTDGFRRCEGTFHCRLADREHVIEMMKTGASYEGVVYRGARDIGRRRMDVVIAGFRTQSDGIVLRLRAAGDWWSSLDQPISRGF